MADTSAGIGRRIRERRVARRMSLKAVAGLAGLSEGYLSRIERGERPVDRRSTLESIARALRVSPVDLSDGWHVATHDNGADAYSALVDLRISLADSSLGDPATEQARPWPALAADLHRLNTTMRPNHDYAGMGAVLPLLIPELHLVAAGNGQHRTAALLGLLDCYSAAGHASKHLGDPSAAQVAALHTRDAANALGDAVSAGRAASLLAQAVSVPARERSLAVARRGAAAMDGELDAPGALETQGMLHLVAALAAAALRRPGDSADHLGEASRLAERVGDVSPFNNAWFGTVNVGFWRVALAVEAGDGASAVQLARTVDPTRIPSAGRQAGYWSDLGRALAMDRRTRGEAVRALRKAEELAPLSVRADHYVRETVLDLMRRSRQDHAGAELRGMAYRMGVPA